MEKVVVHTDGGSRGNPGPSAAACYFPATRESFSHFVPKATNNEAEYLGLILGLESAIEKQIPALKVISDSELVVKQMLGIYRVNKEHLLPLYLKAKVLSEQFAEFEIMHVKREFNKEADLECNRVMDAQESNAN